MTEITVLDTAGSKRNISTLSRDELEQLFDLMVEEQINDGQEPLPRAIVMSLVNMYSQPNIVPETTSYDAERIIAAPMDIALREIVNRMPNDQLQPIADTINKTKSGAASIKMFRPFMQKQTDTTKLRKELREHVKDDKRADQSTTTSVARSPDTIDAQSSDSKEPIVIYPVRATEYILASLGDTFVAAEQTPLSVIGLAIKSSTDRTFVINEKIITRDTTLFIPITRELIESLILHIARWENDYMRWIDGNDRYVDVVRNWQDLSYTGPEFAITMLERTRSSMIEPYVRADEQITSQNTHDTFINLVSTEFGSDALSNADPTVLLGYLSLYGLTGAYISAIYHGADSKHTIAMFDAQVSAHKQNTMRAINARTVLQDREKFITRMQIASKVLSRVRWDIARRAENETMLRAILTTNELKQVDTEYEATMKYITAALNNKCAHIPHYRTFRKAISLEAKHAAWIELSKFVKREDMTAKKRPTKMFSCAVCEFPLVCPHYIEYVKLTQINASAREIRDTLNTYVMDGSDAGAQKCKICYEIMFSKFDLSEDIKADDNYDDDLRRSIYIEAAQLMGQVQFRQPVDVNGLIAQLRDVIYPYASYIDIELKHTQSITSSDVAVRRSAYVSMIIMAKIVQLMAQSRNMYFEKAPKLRKLPELIDFAAGIIMSMKTVVLRDIPGVTKTVVRDRITLGIEAFGKSIDVQPEGAQVESEESFRERIKTDPTYAWISEAIGNNKFEKVMGGSLDNILDATHTGQSIYTLARDVATVYKSPYLKSIFHNYMKYAKQGGKIYNMHELSTISDELGKMIPSKSEWAVTAARESHAWYSRRTRDSVRLFATSLITGEQRFERTHVPLGAIYDENGAQHVYSLYNVMVGGEDRTFTISEIAEISRDRAKLAEIAPNGFRDAIYDQTCKTCGVKRSVAGNLDEKRIREGLRAVTEIAAFYRFYEQRCPADGLTHNIIIDAAKSGSSKCTKCGMMLEWISTVNHTNLGALNFYRAKRDQYIKDSASAAAASTTVDTTAALSSPAKHAAAKWKEHYADVTAVAEIAGVHPRIIQAFGAYEGTTVEAITSGAYIPQHTQKRDDTRVLQVNSIVRGLITAWDRIRNYNRIKTHSAEELEVVGKTPRALLDTLPDIGEGYDELYQDFYWNKSPEQTVSMCIQEWCSRLLIVDKYAKTGNSETSACCSTFVLRQIKHTISSQELFTERQAFNWAIIYGNKDAPDLEENFDPDQESIKRDKLFSLDAFDMDGEVELHGTRF